MTFLMTVMGNCKGGNVSAPGTDSLPTLIPWLDANGQFGFAGSSGRMVVQPQYEDIGLFYNGFAVVKKEGKYGVINTRNEVAIPLKYATAKLVSKDEFTLVITKKEYNTWWHVWHWRWRLK